MKSSLAEQVYAAIRDKIIVGELQGILTLSKMTDYFGTSKTPIREAFNALKQEGLIQVIPSKGYVVTSIDLRDVRELFALRKMLEGGAAELAATNATESDLDELWSLAQPVNLKEQKNVKEFMNINYKFHSKVAEASSNRRLFKLVVDMLQQMQRVLYTDLNTSQTDGDTDDHREIVQAIENKDGIRAMRCMVQHVERSYYRLMNTI